MFAHRENGCLLEFADPVESVVESVPARTGHLIKEGTMIRRAMKFAVAAAVATVFVVGIAALATPTQAFVGHCICPDNIAPVKCSKPCPA